MAAHRPKFNILTPKIVNIEFTFLDGKYKAGDSFPPENVEVSFHQMRSLYKNHRLNNDPDVHTVGEQLAEILTSEPEQEQANVVVTQTNEQVTNSETNVADVTEDLSLFGSTENIVELGNDGSASPWE